MERTTYFNMVKTSLLQMLPFCLLALSPLFTSCGDTLNELPTQSKVDGNLVVDYNSAKVALNGVYYMYAMCGTDNYSVKSTMCASSYEIYPADIAGTATYYQGEYLFETHDPASFIRYCNYTWSPLYGAVNAANAVIEQIGQSSDNYYNGNEKKELLGEAYGIRALTFYNILKYFGYSWDINSPYGIILRTSKSVTTRLPLDRSTVKETYDQILSDLDYAIANTSNATANTNFGQWAAKAIKARVLMMRGQGNDYKDAAALCLDIIQNGGYELDNYVDIFHKNGLNSKEVIFGIQPNENQTNVYEAYYYRNSAQFYPTAKLLALYDKNSDPRKQSMYNGTTICKHLNPATYNATAKTYSTGILEESQYQIRLSEIYLLRAEALARTTNLGDAKALLKTVEQKAGITDFTSLDAASNYTAVMTEIFNEAIKNLSFECGLEHDYMLRFPEEITLQFNPVYKDKQYNIYPLPTDEFKYNNALSADDQNPGYSAE